MESGRARERERRRETVEAINAPSRSPALPLPRSLSLFDLIEADVEDGVSLPVFVVEVPPLEFINGEALRFHHLAQRLAHAALFRGPAGIVRRGALGHLVVDAGHLDFMARARVVERQVYS